MVTSANALPWKFEAFREYVNYQTLQAAAAVLRQYEDEIFDLSNPRIQEMQRLLTTRTGKSTWVPARSGNPDSNWDVEGDVMRNKGRLLTSMFIIEPKDAPGNNGKLRLLPFGRTLAQGKIDEKNFYAFIIRRFKYPHPAYDDNWQSWKASCRSLLPFIYIIQVLVSLYETDASHAWITTDEIARFLHPDPSHASFKIYAKTILDSRVTAIKLPPLSRTDEVQRKINDLLGFLCISGYCYYRPDKSVGLNLRSRHNRELAYYELKRDGEDRLEEIKNLIHIARRENPDAFGSN